METKPFELDPHLRCAYCMSSGVRYTHVLRVPLTFNSQNPLTGDYWCEKCALACTAVRASWAEYAATLPGSARMDDESFVEAWHYSRGLMDTMDAEMVAAAQPDIPEC